MVLPIHWLFFAASTYVWVQFVWHTGTVNSFLVQFVAVFAIEEFPLYWRLSVNVYIIS
jgi:hypothetical protein